jgi:uncharacterized protein involved in exopolysaccharide biosynthesis
LNRNNMHALGPVLAQQPAEGAGPALTILQIFSVLWAHWRLSALLFTVIIGLSVVVIKRLPRSYTATSTLMLNYQVNDPLAGKEYPLFLLGSYISTQLEIMQGPEILDPVITRLGLTQDPDFALGYAPKNGSLLNWVRENLRSRMSLAAGTAGSQLIHITMKAKSPDRAVLLADAVADEFVTQQVQRLNAPVNEQASRYSAEVQVLADRVNEVQARINAVRKKTGLADLVPGQSDFDVSALTNLEARYLEAQNVRRNAEVRLRASSASGVEGKDSLFVNSLRGQLAQYDTQMAQLRTTYGSQHPKVLELQNQIDATKRSLEVGISANVAGNSVELSAARELEQKFKEALDQQRAKTQQVRSVQDDSAKLFLELDSARNAYKEALSELEHAQVAARGNYTNISVMSHAEAPVRPTSPKSMKLFIAAVLGGGFVSLLLPFLVDLLFYRRVRCRDDVTVELGLPLLVEFSPFTQRGRA